MSVWKPKTSPYYQYDFQFKGTRFYGSTGCKTKRDAERYEANERRKVALGTVEKPTITVDEACGLWWEERGKHLRSAATSEYFLGALVQGLGGNRVISDLTIRDFDAYAAKRRKGRSAASVNREIEQARRVWRYVASRDYDVSEIKWGALLRKEAEQRTRELTADEERRLFAALPESYRPMVEFALLSGQRKNEVMSLLWRDVDLAGGRALIRLKGGTTHRLPLTPRMVALIAKQPQVCPQVFTYVCTRPAPPKGNVPRRLKGERYPFSRDGWRRVWATALREAGIENFRFHDLRHTTGTRALRATGNLQGVSKLLGHTNVTTTARYAHAMEEDVREILRATESRNSPEAEVIPIAKNRRFSRIRRP